MRIFDDEENQILQMIEKKRCLHMGVWIATQLKHAHPGLGRRSNMHAHSGDCKWRSARFRIERERRQNLKAENALDMCSGHEARELLINATRPPSSRHWACASVSYTVVCPRLGSKKERIYIHGIKNSDNRDWKSACADVDVPMVVTSIMMDMIDVTCQCHM